MIPKIIHYCWFGKGMMPQSHKRCIEGWQKVMPDYTFVRWDETNFDVNYCQFSSQAYLKKKYAFVADVARLFALSHFGGIYLDTDVSVYQRFDRFLNYDFFSGIELYREFETENIAEIYLNDDGTAKHFGTDIPRLEILTSTMGCCINSPLITSLLEYYKSISITTSPEIDLRGLVNFDRLVARFLTHYGFRYINETQYLNNNMVVYGTGIFGHAFCPDDRYEVSYHHNAATWESERWTRAQRHSYFFDKIGLLPVYQGYKKLKKKVRGLLFGK